MTLIGLCVLGLLFGNLQNGAHAASRVSLVDRAVRIAVEPVAIPLSSSTRAVSDFFGGIVSARRLSQENRRLKALLPIISLYTEQIEIRDKEIERLRTMQGFGSVPGKKRVPASVCGLSINENRLTLNVGSNQGVKLGCPVECGEGLVGTIEEVEPNQCQVLMLTSAGLQPTSQGKTQMVGAIDIDRKPPLDGVVRGENASMLSMQFWDPKAPVQIGDLIVTSGHSDRIPKGLAIGKVIQTEPNLEFGVLKAKIDPAFSPGLLDVVFVLV